MPLFFVVEEDEVFEIAFEVSTYETSKRFINQKTIKCFWNSDLNDIIWIVSEGCVETTNAAYNFKSAWLISKSFVRAISKAMTVAADVKKKALKTVWHDNHPTSWYTCKINMRKCYRHSEQSLIEKSVKLFRISSNYWYHNARNFSVKPNRTKIWTFILQFYHSYVAQWWILRNAFALFGQKFREINSFITKLLYCNMCC